MPGGEIAAWPQDHSGFPEQPVSSGRGNIYARAHWQQGRGQQRLMGREKARLWTWVQILAPLSVNCVCDLGPLLNVSELLNQ